MNFLCRVVNADTIKSIIRKIGFLDGDWRRLHINTSISTIACITVITDLDPVFSTIDGQTPTIDVHSATIIACDLISTNRRIP